MKNNILLALSLLLISPLAQAASWSFTNLAQDDVDRMTKELSANTSLHSVLPPSAMGSIFGLELGLVGGVTKSPTIDGLAKRFDATASVPSIVHLGLVGAVTVPLGLTIEAVVLPKMETTEFSYTQYALGLKWTMTDTVLSVVPFMNIALRGFTSKSDLIWKQTQGAYTFSVESGTQVTGAQLLVSPKLWVVEPYFGVGMASATGSLKQSGTSALPVFADGTSSKNSQTSTTQILAGVDVRLLIIGAGIEYMKQFGTDSITAKLSLKF